MEHLTTYYEHTSINDSKYDIESTIWPTLCSFDSVRRHVYLNATFGCWICFKNAISSIWYSNIRWITPPTDDETVLVSGVPFVLVTLTLLIAFAIISIDVDSFALNAGIAADDPDDGFPARDIWSFG